MLDVLVIILGFMVAMAAFVRAMYDHFTLKRKLTEMERKAADISRMLRERGKLANELAHEIKNPITAIVCSAEALDHMIGDEIDENHRKCLGYIREYGDNLLHMVGDFLDLSRAESGYVECQLQAISLLPVIQSILALLQSASIKRHVFIRHLVQPEDLMVYTDPKHLKKVLFNLLHHAIAISPPKGSIELEARREGENIWASVSIREWGDEVTAQDMSAMFDPYTSHQNKGTQQGQITDISMAVSKMLVEACGGSIGVRREPSGALCMYFTVPLAPQVKAETTVPDKSLVQAEIRPLLGQKILLVDHDPGPRDSVAKLIESLGGAVDQVTEAAEAIKALGKNVYDAVMVDSGHEGSGGREVTRLIRSELKSGATRLIVAASDEAERESAKDAGADSCVDKPLNGKSLLATLRSPGKPTPPH